LDIGPITDFLKLLLTFTTDARVGSFASLAALIGTVVVYFRTGRIKSQIERQSFLRFELSNLRLPLVTSTKRIRGALTQIMRGGSLQENKLKIDGEITKSCHRLGIISKGTKNSTVRSELRQIKRQHKSLPRLSQQAYIQLVGDIHTRLDALTDHLKDLEK